MLSNSSMIGGVVEWFLGRAGDRRQYKRRQGAFHLWWMSGAGSSPQNARPGMGLDISPNGLMFIIPDEIATAEYNLVLRISEARIPVRVRDVRKDKVEQNGKTWNRHMGEFTGIAADDWDRIVRYVNNQEEVKDRRKMQNQDMAHQTDDAYRLLPLAIQEKIVKLLVEKHRLEPPVPGKPPLLKLFYGGLVRRPGKETAAHRINVHSRISINDELMAYDTRFLVEDDGTVTFG
jgi:hypothetical protein